MPNVQRPWKVAAAVPLLVLSITAAGAEPLAGRVLDKKSGVPIEGAVVHVAGAEGWVKQVSTVSDGSYVVDAPPGKYTVTFLHAGERVTGQVVVVAGAPTKLDGRIKTPVPEVIVLEDTKAPTVMPEPIDRNIAISAPPYSDQAILEDAWTRAWLLLDVDATGVVQQVKFLKRPGYDLDDIAVERAFSLRFTPGRNAKNQPVRTLIIWPFEWVANSWLLRFGNGMRTRMPDRSWGEEGRSKAAYVPCKGDGPWMMTAVYRGYRDCSKPDLSRAKHEPWILPSR